MAKPDKRLPARRQRERSEDSLLIRSAESLGRVIGSLQRQLDGASKRLGAGRDAMTELMPFGNDGDGSDNGVATSRPASARKAPARAAKRATESPAAKKSATAASAKREARSSGATRRTPAVAKKSSRAAAAKKTTAKSSRQR